MPSEHKRRVPQQLRGAALAVASVLIGVPLVLAAWIALLFAAERLQIAAAPHVLFAWLLSLLVSAVLWPMSMRGMRRYFWASRTASPGNVPSWGSQHFKAEPRQRLSPGQRGARAGAVLVGMGSLLLICGPGDISRSVLEGLNVIGGESGSWWLAVQLGTWLLAMLAFLPTLWITDRRLKKSEADSTRRQDLLLEQNWWLSAATSWAICVMMGLIFTWLAIDKLG
ncbi:hypothetical protein AUR04nite_03830 [Glutamicibacter uratoxydans]|uniref:Uncharacterized protein n=1 Tax=Glutamicibacter uratoxydans TaxID=43667 RepID=A0A4Y4DQT7_GLUUR|nr:hypothetical protein [Glutamicibacter uratoxydans]GED04851.1 hypothetical protein AUR04nite_03830 [Glutamicibacter uratoxydans]